MRMNEGGNAFAIVVVVKEVVVTVIRVVPELWETHWDLRLHRSGIKGGKSVDAFDKKFHEGSNADRTTLVSIV
jgi:hypothetical protein